MGLGHDVLAYILNCPDDRFAALSVKTLAALNGVSRVWLSRAFHRQVGLPLRLVLRRERLERAKELLRREPAASLAEVRSRVGYQDTKYFRGLFRAYFGLPPGRMRPAGRGRAGNHKG